MEKCRAMNDELTARAWKLEQDLETMTKMYEAAVRGRKTEAAPLHGNSRPASVTSSGPAAAAPASPPSPLVTSAEEILLPMSVCLSVNSYCCCCCF